MGEDQLKYPIGTFVPTSLVTPDRYINEIKQIIPTLYEVMNTCGTQGLELTYRPGGWSVKQIIHHMADNDMNAFIRLRRALTEHEPIVGSYEQDEWAKLNDYSETPVEISMKISESIHTRLINLLIGLQEADFSKRFTTSALGTITVNTAIQRFIWHNQHHIAQIRNALRE